MILRTKGDIETFANVLRARPLPMTVAVSNGKARSVEQNKLQRLWCREIAEQLGDRTPEDVRAWCKLTMGVPIMRAENDAFCAAYDKTVKPLPYETKLAIMAEPLDMPVTRLMTVSQKVRYLDHIQRHFLEMGLQLTDPDPIMARAQ